MTGAELARRLDVNIRTVRRYIATLQDIGVPIFAERGRYGAYVLGVGFRLPPMMFTNDEALALELGLLAADQLSGGQKAAIESARAKLDQVLPSDVRRRARALNATLHLTLNTDPTAPAPEILLLLSQATQRCSSIHIQYCSREGEPTTREIDPLRRCLSPGPMVRCWMVPTPSSDADISH